jgi:hypothetical protein
MGVSLAGALALTWWLLPLGDDSGNEGSGISASTPAPQPSVVQTSTTATPQQSNDVGTKTLLTPDGIRTAIAALKKESGRNRFGSFLVYPEYASADMMVKGSDTAYDSYTYRLGEGVEQGIIKGSLSSGDQPVSLDDFNWDRLPALLAEADKKLKVDKPKYRYVSVRLPDVDDDTPARIAVYLSDEYSRVGFLEADPQGKVTEVNSADD